MAKGPFRDNSFMGATPVGLDAPTMQNGAWSGQQAPLDFWGQPIPQAAPAGGASTGSSDPLGELLGNARSRVSDLTNDPVDAMIRSRLQDVMGGKIAPYDEATKNAMFTSQADQAGAGEAARNQQLMDSVAMNGGSLNDPSARAAMNENMLQRQLANQGAHLNVDANANTANFNAAQQATGALAANNATHQNMITQASQYLGGQLGQVTKQLPSMMPNFSQFQSGFTSAAPTQPASSFSFNPTPYNNASGGITNTLRSPDNPAPVWGTGYYAGNTKNADGSSQTRQQWANSQPKAEAGQTPPDSLRNDYQEPANSMSMPETFPYWAQNPVGYDTEGSLTAPNRRLPQGLTVPNAYRNYDQ